MAFRNVTHCILDLDGTIVDTEKVYFKSIDGVLQQFEKRHSLELCHKVIDRTRQDYSKIIVEDAELPITSQEFLKRMDAISHSMFLNSELLPAAKKLIHHLYEHCIPAAISGLDSFIRTQPGLELSIAGDFNAAHSLWTGYQASSKGSTLADRAAQCDFSLINRARFTFSRNGDTSTLDLTFAIRDLTASMTFWKIGGKDSLSGRLYRTYSVSTTLAHPQSIAVFPRHNLETLIRTLAERVPNLPYNRPKILAAMLEKASKKHDSSSLMHPGLTCWTHKYWWNAELAEAKRVRIRARRQLTRSRSRRDFSVVPVQELQYREARRAFNKAVGRSKAVIWKDLLQQLNQEDHPSTEAVATLIREHPAAFADMMHHVFTKGGQIIN